MKILRDQDIFKNPVYKMPDRFVTRKTVKVIVENNKGEIALVTNPIHQLYLFPGGGAESDDLFKEAKREALEEINYHIDIKKEIGTLEEFRNRDAKHYYTTYFLAVPIKTNITDLRTEEEKKNGLEAIWLKKDEVEKILAEQVKKVRIGEIGFYNTAFNIVRDEYFFTLVF